MAARNVSGAKDFNPTRIALVGEAELKAYLDDPTNFGKVKNPKTGVMEPKRRTLTLSSAVNEGLYCAAVRYAANNPDDPGGLKDGDVASGFLTRANRYALSSLYMPEFDFWPWQREEAARISAERSERMSSVADDLKLSREEVKGKLSLLERLLSNPKLRAEAMKDADEETLKLISLLSDSDDDA